MHKPSRRLQLDTDMTVVNDCHACPRLNAYRRDVQHEFPDYYCKPVPAYGEPSARLLIVGLAPGKHGANATGIPFTGDASGKLLFDTLAKNDLLLPSSAANEDFIPELKNCRITNAVKCLPPQNRPLSAEINQCNHFLKQEIQQLGGQGLILSLGAIAHRAVLRAVGLTYREHPFKHGAEVLLPSDQVMFSSYHCSRYNVQTGRLTAAMLHSVFQRIRKLLDDD